MGICFEERQQRTQPLTYYTKSNRYKNSIRLPMKFPTDKALRNSSNQCQQQ